MSFLCKLVEFQFRGLVSMFREKAEFSLHSKLASSRNSKLVSFCWGNQIICKWNSAQVYYASSLDDFTLNSQILLTCMYNAKDQKTSTSLRINSPEDSFSSNIAHTYESKYLSVKAVNNIESESALETDFVFYIMREKKSFSFSAECYMAKKFYP